MKQDYTAIKKITSIKFMKQACRNKIERTAKIVIQGT
jgi:hypothetical protein